MIESSRIDILEDEILKLSPELLDKLLLDHTTHENIYWATDDYSELGDAYAFDKPILPELITGENGHVIMPRVAKSREQQTARSRDMAEVFTPSWICNKQNNLVDAAWFGHENAFNTEIDNTDGTNTWEPSPSPVVFPEGKTWQDYVRETRMEITCGEAPYLVSRYDTTTGEIIPLERRIGLLDRKLRVISENVDDSGEWLEFVQEAYKHTYAYEWQGDNLLLARENLFYTFLDYYQAKFHKMPLQKSMMYIAYIISWNVWQMDGLKFGLPGHTPEPLGLFEPEDIRDSYCLIRDWWKPSDVQKTPFVNLVQV